MSRRVLEVQDEKHRIQIVFDRKQSAATCSLPAWQEETPVGLKKCFDQLGQLVGLTQVKAFVKEIYAWLEIGKRRQAAGLSSEQQVLHMVFTGNPGTGKTTVARIMSGLFREMGMLSKGHLVEVERADLVGEYIGHTAQKTREHVNKALGGILFIDEAYSLARGGEKDFGKEAIDTLVKAMEDHKNDFILILAGYSWEMSNFLSSNPGLPSRFPVQLEFSDFPIQQLLEIAECMTNERQYRLSVAAKEKLRNHVQREMERLDRPFGNARYIRNSIEQAVRQHAVRLLQMPYANRNDLMTLRSDDFQLDEVEKKTPVQSWYN
ncbi:AAA family ATPase [Baia soyae]|uniref:Stage V sporulation protein K n=1 Tax=Baia soyae TaxID=1544746 RepID=A0A4R2S012_9BACL|nr:AAA family ATPase [Baia soyae]TCP69134.1 stage V sporulation protein K [Baia soyae]